jgi:hypothetical protein
MWICRRKNMIGVQEAFEKQTECERHPSKHLSGIAGASVDWL